MSGGLGAGKKKSNFLNVVNGLQFGPLGAIFGAFESAGHGASIHEGFGA